MRLLRNPGQAMQGRPVRPPGPVEKMHSMRVRPFRNLGHVDCEYECNYEHLTAPISKGEPIQALMYANRRSPLAFGQVIAL